MSVGASERPRHLPREVPPVEAPLERFSMRFERFGKISRFFPTSSGPFDIDCFSVRADPALFKSDAPEPLGLRKFSNLLVCDVLWPCSIVANGGQPEGEASL